MTTKLTVTKNFPQLVCNWLSSLLREQLSIAVGTSAKTLKFSESIYTLFEN